MICCCTIDTVAIDGVCHVCRRPKEFPSPLQRSHEVEALLRDLDETRARLAVVAERAARILRQLESSPA